MSMPAKNYPSGWRKVRQEVLERDGYRCQIRTRVCTVAATEVDHIIPLEHGGAVLDPINLRAACRPCNRFRVDKDRWRSGRTSITLVWGPPCAGKTTYVEQNAEPGDLIVDLDKIAQSLGSPSTHDHDPAILSSAQRVRSQLLDQLRRGKTEAARAWIVSTHKDAPSIFPHHKQVLLDPGAGVAHKRADAALRPSRWHQLIDEWYSVPPSTGSRDW